MKNYHSTSVSSEPDFKFVKTITSNKKAFKGGLTLNSKKMKKLCKALTSSSKLTKSILYIIYTNNGYKNLGYSSFKAFVENELTITYDAAWKQARSAKIAYSICGQAGIDLFSDSSMLAHIYLNNEEINEVKLLIESKHGKEMTTEGKYTQKIVEEAIDTFREKNSLNEHPIDSSANESQDMVEMECQPTEGCDLEISDIECSQSEDSSMEVLVTEPKLISSPIIKSLFNNVSKENFSISLNQFIDFFTDEVREKNNVKAIFTAFLKTEAGSKKKTLKQAIKMLEKQLKKCN